MALSKEFFTYQYWMCRSRSTDWLVNFQLTHFCRSLANHIAFTKSLREFEKMCTRKQGAHYLLSIIYGLLFGLEEIETYKFTTAWSKHLGFEMSTSQAVFSLYTYSRLSISGYSQEQNYKILIRSYRDLCSIQKIFPSFSYTCWQFGSCIGTYFHTWWECAVIKAF